MGFNTGMTLIKDIVAIFVTNISSQNAEFDHDLSLSITAMERVEQSIGLKFSQRSF